MKKLCIAVPNGWNSPKFHLVDMETGIIDKFSNWIFLGLDHVKHREFIPRKNITEKLVEELFNTNLLFYQNGKCQWTVRDMDCGTTRTWGNRPLRIFFTEE